MARAQKPDFVFRRNGRVHLNRRGRQFSPTTGSRGVRISGNNAGYTIFRGSVKSTGYPLHLPVSPSLPLPCVTVCHHISTGVYSFLFEYFRFRLSVPIHSYCILTSHSYAIDAVLFLQPTSLLLMYVYKKPDEGRSVFCGGQMRGLTLQTLN